MTPEWYSHLAITNQHLKKLINFKKHTSVISILTFPYWTLAHICLSTYEIPFFFTSFREELPGSWAQDLDKFQAIIVLKALRPDKVTNAMQDYIAENMGQRFIEPQTTDLDLVYKDSSPTIPLVFVLSQGTDPANDLYKFAETMRFAKKLSAISLGQGQVRI